MIPSNLRYQSAAETVPARRFMSQIAPQNGTGPYLPNETITINIPTRSNTALIPSESYLKGTLNLIAATAAPTFAQFESCGVHGFLQRIRIFHGSSLIEDCDNYNQYAKILFDMQAPDDTVKGRFSITTGTNSSYNVIDTSNVGAINRGATQAMIAGTLAVPFSINLISLVGSLCGEKYLLLDQMSASPLRVEIVLRPNLLSSMLVRAGSATGLSFSMSNLQYCGEFLQLNDSTLAAIKAGSSSPIQMVVPSVRSYTNSASVPNNSNTQIQFPLPAKFSSLKSIVVATRTSLGEDSIYPLSHLKLGLLQYFFRVGAEVIPSTAPSSVPEYFNEVCKCFGSIADLQLQPSIDLRSYSVDGPAAAVTTQAAALIADSGSFVTGIDMEIFQNTNTSTIFAGTNTNNVDTYYVANYLQASGSAVTIYQTGFATFDQVLVFENGVCYARY